MYEQIIPQEDDYLLVYGTLTPNAKLDSSSNILSWACMGSPDTTCSACNSCTCRRPDDKEFSDSIWEILSSYCPISIKN